MIQAEWIQALQEHGVDQQASKELLLYDLTAEGRQAQMLEGIKEHADMKRDGFRRIIVSYFTAAAKYLVYLFSYGTIQHIKMLQEDRA